jgi:hypothetical protein
MNQSSANSIKYLLFPGLVISRVDGDSHFVGAQELASLYGVPLEQCAVRPAAATVAACKDICRRHDLIELHPRSDGNYTPLSKEK